MTTGIIIVSHVYEIAKGINRLLQEVASDVNIEVVGGISEVEIGTSFSNISFGKFLNMAALRIQAMGECCIKASFLDLSQFIFICILIQCI